MGTSGEAAWGRGRQRKRCGNMRSWSWEFTPACKERLRPRWCTSGTACHRPASIVLWPPPKGGTAPTAAARTIWLQSPQAGTHAPLLLHAFNVNERGGRLSTSGKWMKKQLPTGQNMLYIKECILLLKLSSTATGFVFRNHLTFTIQLWIHKPKRVCPPPQLLYLSIKFFLATKTPPFHDSEKQNT